MPGIGGFVLGGEKNLRQKEEPFLKSLLWGNEYDSRIFRDEQAGTFLASISNHKIPFCRIEIDDRFQCVFYGEVYPVSGNKGDEAYREAVSRLIKDIIADGADVLNITDGTFLLAVWDSKENSLLIANDIFGTYPLHYFFSSQNFIFSTQLKAVTALMPSFEIDEIGIAELLAVSMPVNGRTCIKNAARLTPGTLIKFKNGQLSKEVYFQPSYNQDTSGKLKDRLTDIGRNFETAAANRFSKDELTAAALSGGFDTRAIWSLIINKEYAATAVTRGLEDSADMQLAKKIAAGLHLPHETHILDSLSVIDFPAWAEQAVRMTEGFMNLRSALLVPYYSRLGTQFETMIDGSGGALYRRQAFWRYGTPGSPKDLASFTLSAMRQPLFSSGIISDNYKETYTPEIKQDINEYYNSISNLGLDGDLLDLFYLQQICGLRTSADLMFQSHFINCRHPFYDRQTFEKVRAFSIQERKKLHIHKYLIKQYFPNLENFPLESNDHIIPYHGFKWKRLIPLILDHFTGNSKALQFKKYPLLKPQGYFRDELNRYLKDTLLDQNSKIRTFMNMNKIEQIIKDHEQNTFDYSAHFFQALTVELFLRHQFK